MSRFRKKAPIVHELSRTGTTIICSTCGRLPEVITAEVNGKPKQDYCPVYFRALLRGEHQIPKKGDGQRMRAHVPTTVHGKSFQSKLEARRWVVLCLQQKRGEIENLQTQQTIRLEVNGRLVCKYIADFTYNLPGDTHLIVEDTKGYETEVFILKKKLFRAIFGYDIVLTRKHEVMSRQVRK